MKINPSLSSCESPMMGKYFSAGKMYFKTRCCGRTHMTLEVYFSSSSPVIVLCFAYFHTSMSQQTLLLEGEHIRALISTEEQLLYDLKTLHTLYHNDYCLQWLNTNLSSQNSFTLTYSTLPFLPCGSLQLSCRQAPQVDHWESRQWFWHGIEHRWTADGGSSPAHSLAFTGLDTE